MGFLRRRWIWIPVAAFVILYLMSAQTTIPALKYHSPRAPVHQTLYLGLDLPTSVTNRDFIVTHYVNNLISQLEGKAVSYKPVNDIVYQKRKEHVDGVCKKWTKGRDFQLDPNYVKGKTWYLSDPKLMYCPVAKGGSTFWRRAFEVIRRKDPKIKSPFQLSYLDFKEGNAKLPPEFTKPENNNAFKELLDTTVKFLFTRDPYHRVFSAYVDKILSPNSYMWGLGKKAVSKFRPSAQNGTKSCGADVTFSEFVKYINTLDSRSYDQHFKPVGYVCDPCKMPFDVIAKMETFQADTRYILNKVGQNGRDIVFQDMSTEYKVDQIIDLVIRAFAFRNSWSNCISVHAGNTRLWRQLQIGGVINMADSYPLTEKQSNNITVTEYLNMALAAFKRSSVGAKRNKQDAFLQAFATLTKEDLETLREKFLIDFEMFDYEQRPVELFSQPKPESSGVDYFDVMWLK